MINDPKGYCKILGLDSSASNNEIKKAFRTKAHELHPDKNNNSDTTKAFQLLSEAYEVLLDPEKKSKYDISGITIEERSSNNEPIRCSFCEKVSAQPRYIIFFEVKSFLVITTRNTVQGIFCPDCAQKKVIKPTLVTWLIGWWGFPFGILYSLQAITVNLFGGKKPKDINANILSYQAWYFAQHGKLDIANSIADDALKFATKRKQIDKLHNFKQNLFEHNNKINLKKLKNKWKLFSKSFVIQLLIILLIITIIIGSIAMNNYQEKKDNQLRKNEQIAYALEHPIQPLPDNGKKYEFYEHTGTMAPFKIITRGNEHHFIKLEDFYNGITKLKIFVRSGQTIVTQIPLGTYRMKYATGYDWYGEKNLFGNETQYSQSENKLIFSLDGNQIIGNTVELFLQKNGNLKTNRISTNDF